MIISSKKIINAENLVFRQNLRILLFHEKFMFRSWEIQLFMFSTILSTSKVMKSIST